MAPNVVRDNDRAYGRVFTSLPESHGHSGSTDFSWIAMAKSVCGAFDRHSASRVLDRTLIFGEAHLRRVLSEYATYYNEVRTHLALGKDTPMGRAVQRSGNIIAIPILSGLHHHYVRI